ncbi:MAG: EF-P beta-lysylation protein EpmB, partial [Natronospirillum sp.]
TLLSVLRLTNPPQSLADMVTNPFPVRVTRHFAGLMEPENWHDPLLQQVLPWGSEHQDTGGYTTDPLGEEAATVLPGLIHKYPSRVLIVPTSACAIHCRYCFRRHFPYAEHRLTRQHQDDIVQYLRDHPDVNEVIFSGGDPLMLTDAHLGRWLSALETVDTLTRVRLHTRLPIVLPDRVTSTLVQRLTQSRLQAVMVLHSNHPNELSPELAKALQPLRTSEVLLLNQAVLLRGVNDSVAVQSALAERLFALGVLPYYVHQTDKVAGTAHFAVSDETALHLHQRVKASLPGFLVPKLVREIAGQSSKTWLP